MTIRFFVEMLIHDYLLYNIHKNFKPQNGRLHRHVVRKMVKFAMKTYRGVDVYLHHS
jgi:hypothetical protein